MQPENMWLRGGLCMTQIMNDQGIHLKLKSLIIAKFGLQVIGAMKMQIDPSG